LQPGKVVIVLAGRFAGRKAVIVRNFDDGAAGRPYGHALVAGIDDYPRKVTRSMTKAKIHHRSKVRPFFRVINYAHLMPTRYNLGDVGKDTIVSDIQQIVTLDALKKGNRKAAKKALRGVFETRHRSGQNTWFFTKLRF
jgi:large subunit ribosomal protein L27e